MAVCENCGCKFDKRRDKKAFKDYFKGELGSRRFRSSRKGYRYDEWRGGI